MKNLTPLIRKKTYWDNIVNNKQAANKTQLLGIRTSVIKRFNKYNHHTIPNTLELIPPSPFLTPNIDLLKSCYSKSNEINKLKSKINQKQNIILRSECQYCNIGEPNTFDHYLPQVYFPEYSALSINLIPCCSKCNTKKGEEWLLAGRRKIINYYYDTLPNTTYLECTIIYKNRIPQAIFIVNDAIVPIGMRNIIINHFNTLELTTRYKQRSNSEISDILAAITPHIGQMNRIQIQQQLRIEASNMQASKGRNYWRAILRVALSNSNEFLTQSGF